MINGSTRLFGIIGDPVAHSLSPAMHNACFAAMGLNNVYVAMRPTSLAGAITGLRSLGFVGVSVTVPFKVEVMRHLDAIDPVAARIGSVNTLVFQRQQDDSVRCTGHNTDWIGANQALGDAEIAPQIPVGGEGDRNLLGGSIAGERRDRRRGAEQRLRRLRAGRRAENGGYDGRQSDCASKETHFAHPQLARVVARAIDESKMSEHA